MRNSLQQELRNELHGAGAKTAEINELIQVADQLGSLGSVLKQRTVNAHRRRIARPLMSGAIGFFLGVLIVAASEIALPTSPLYSIQKLSDGVAMDLYPQYKVDVMMKLARQVDELVSARADSTVILATLTDYKEKASTYESDPHSHYAALEYCKASLQKASSVASPTVRRAITADIQTLEST